MYAESFRVKPKLSFVRLSCDFDNCPVFLFCMVMLALNLCFVFFYNCRVLLCSSSSVCFEPGVCTESFLLWEGQTDTLNECLQLCKDKSNCTWFSYYLEFSVCLLLSDCEILNQEECPDCVSGQTTCTPEFSCHIPGQCQVNFNSWEEIFV